MPAAFASLAFVFAAQLAGALGPAAALERYGESLAAVSEPAAVTFEYTIEQVGTRALYQTHRVYRSVTRVRDETIAVDGHPLTTPSVRIATGRPNRYRIAQVAPPPTAYSFHFVKAQLAGHHWEYVFDTTPSGTPGFIVTSVTIDGLSFLPSAIAFKTSYGTIEGAGILHFAKVERYWLIQQARVAAPIAGATAEERITWRNYQFPQSLPAATFGA